MTPEETRDMAIKAITNNLNAKNMHPEEADAAFTVFALLNIWKELEKANAIMAIRS